MKATLCLTLATILVLMSGLCGLTCLLALIFGTGNLLASTGLAALSGFGCWVCGSAAGDLLSE